MSFAPKENDQIGQGGPERFTLLIALSLLLTATSADSAQYTAYSLNVARERIEQADETWREKERDVVTLSGINQVHGFVYDATKKDLILIGTQEEGRAPLTLDELVVALRARFRYNQWPLVSIDPTSDLKKTEMQHVRFEGGIQGTAFGQALFEADYRLKEMGMGLVSPGVAGLRTDWDRSVEQVEIGTPMSKQVLARFWFYPINPSVTVRQGVCVVRGLKVGVFTEVLEAKIGGQAVPDLKDYRDAIGDAFANDISTRFDDLCRAHASFNRLRALQELVGISKALQELDEKPDIAWWLEKFRLVTTETPQQTKVLHRRHEGRKGYVEMSGGVHMTALAVRLNAGDATALREAVLSVRPSPQALSWSFLCRDWIVPLEGNQPNLEDLEQLFQHAVFLIRQKQYRSALELYDRMSRLAPDHHIIWANKAYVLGALGRWPESLDCCERAVALTEAEPIAWGNRALALASMQRWEDALRACNRALELAPHDSGASLIRVRILTEMGRSAEAFSFCEGALRSRPDDANMWYAKSDLLLKSGRWHYDEALNAARQATVLDPQCTGAWINKADALRLLGRESEAKNAADRAVLTGPGSVDLWMEVARLLFRLKSYAPMPECMDRILELQPDNVDAWNGKGCALGNLGRHEEAVKCFDEQLRRSPRDAYAWFNKGLALARLDRYAEAREALQQAANCGHPDAQKALAMIRKKRK